MRTQFVLSLAVGFVAASPCKPLTSAVTTVPESPLTSSTTELTESTTIETPATIETSVTETFTPTITDTTSSETIIATLTTASADTTTLLTVDTSATETLTSSVVDTPSNELTSATITASSADATTLYTTQTSAETTEETTTLALSETPTAEMSTTTTEATEPTGFFIIAGEGPTLGKKLQSSKALGSVVLFNPDRGSQFEARRFTVDDSTGVLTNEGTPMCAFFNPWAKDRARVSLCDQESHEYGTSYFICDRSPGSGDILHCTAVKLDCWQTGPSNQRCQVAEEDQLWNNQFFIQRIPGDEESYLLFGQDNLSETSTSESSTIEKVDLFVNVAMVSAPPE